MISLIRGFAMPAATNKSDLLTITEKEFAKLQALLDTVPADAWLAPDPEAEGTTLKDIVGHRAAWIDLFLGWYLQGQTGTPVPMPAPGYKWNELKRFNADLRREQAALGWTEVRAALTGSHARLIAFLSDLDDDALYGVPMRGGGNAWTTGRWAEAAGPSHYRSAAKYIRARLKALKSGALSV
ncbi:ClbS/DfsB family four-helix bundle protein [Mesobacterium sp. TK19101]|uniref:ClbS/DfsB family four-helix bundle protein n=1 Tax=Mesobacterium hydrothermale TaxID=3111907 RepID=A0ABU6HGL8_9RHOB|nr:ClbS/DfsB family four-helix bundle protein [Mesobacterium sp. TK19101]MEC3860904.1 ClbS/DfsB family four-helix bundle protein [Mesobacterium sp. TK19101]